MSEKSVIIIGAGLAGLSAGSYARMNGYRARIFEHHAVAGGVVAAWKRKDYLIDGGIHFLMGHKPGAPTHGMFRELGVMPELRVTDMENYGRFTDEVTGVKIDAVSDLDRFSAALKSLSPDDARLAEDLIAGARGVRGFGMPGLDKPPDLMGPWDGVKLMWGLRRVLKYFGGKYGRTAAEFARDARHPAVRKLIENLFLPEVPVWFALMVLAMLADRQLGIPVDGSKALIGLLEKRCAELGVEFTYKATVEKVLVENDRAVGVRLADGSEHRADFVISAADGYSTIFRMLDGRYKNQKIEYWYGNWKLFRPWIMASFGVAREFPGEPHAAVIFLKAPVLVGDRKIEGIFTRVFNYGPSFAPPGKSVMQVSFETEWDYWNDLNKQDRPRYVEEKKRVASELLNRLEPHYPGLTAQVEVTDVATPYTTWRYTRNYKGAFEGWLPTPEAIRTSVKRTLPGLSNFVMAGQWVMPGGGVVPSLYSGRHAVQILCHRDGKRFTVSTP